jgi:hypothetical protein
MMAKVANSVLGVFWQGTKLYFSNSVNFFKYLSFPVFGQVLGIVLILFASYFYSCCLQQLVVEGSVFDNFLVIFLILFLVTLPGLFVLIKAFWEYLVAYGAINSMVENMLKSGKVYDFHAHTEVITRRSASFGTLWLLLAILGLIGSFPLFWVISGILAIYFILIFQVFVFEPDKSPFGCFKKSMAIVKGHFASTLGLMALLGVFTYWLIPDAIKYLFEFSNIITVLAIPFDSLSQQLPINEINIMLRQFHAPYQITSLGVAKAMVDVLLGYILTCMTLPWRSICCALWYKNLNKGEVKLEKRILERAEKKTR